MTVRRLTYLIPLALLSLVLLRPATAQTAQTTAELEAERTATEQRLRELQAQITREQTRLSEKQEAEDASVERLRSVEREIAIRTELTENYQRRLRQLNVESDEIVASLEALEADIERLKTQYRQRAAHAYKYGRMHDVALIMAARSINQMLVRARYLGRFADERQAKLGDIEAAGDQLVEQREELEATRARTEELLTAADEERRTLEGLQGERRQVIRALRQERQAIEASIQQTQADISALRERLTALAEAAARAQRERVAVNPNAAAAYEALTGSFEQNEGRLPWPSDGVVTEPFGDLVNPVYGTRTPNPGILIATEPGAAVRAVFDGEVIEVSILPDFGRYVVIAHGEYMTVYSNFSLLYIAEGDTIDAGQVIGRAGTDAEARGSGLFFALFKSEEGAVDPVPWLQRR